MKRVLLTGAGGFIGSHMLDHLLVNTDWDVVCLASWRHKGIPERITDSIHYQQHKKRVTVLTHDLSAPLPGHTLARIGDIDYILNFAAESHVDRSLADPRSFIENNVAVALTMLDAARIIQPDVFIQISTDEVYGPAPDGHLHKEGEPHRPSNPYSASKSAQESIAYAYWRSFGVPVIITNTMNNFGERQDAEKFVPMVIRQVKQGRPVTIHGGEGNIGGRFYLHARNHADAVLYILKHCPPMPYRDGTLDLRRFNVVGERELNNLEMAELIASFVGKPLYHRLEDFHRTRPGHDRRYALDGVKLGLSGWEAPFSLEDSLRATVEWTLTHKEWL